MNGVGAHRSELACDGDVAAGAARHAVRRHQPWRPDAGLRGSADCGSGLRYALGRFSPRAPLRELAALSASKARPGEVIVLKAQAPLLGGCTSLGASPPP